MEDIILFILAFAVLIIGTVAWKLRDDFKHETRGLRKLRTKKAQRLNL